MHRIVLPTEPTRDALLLTDVLQALSDPVRLSIVFSLAERGDLPCGSFDLRSPKSTQSHHFRVLRTSGVISTRREGKELINSLRRDDLDARFPGLLTVILDAAPVPSVR